MKKALKVLILTASMMLIFFSFSSYGAEAETENILAEAVEIISAENMAGYMKISWKEYEGATSYELQKKVDDGQWGEAYAIESTVFEDDDTKNGRIYTYRVRAVTENGESEFSEISNMYLGSPVIKSVKNSAEGLVVKWKKCTVATGYKVYRKASNGKSYKLVATINGNKTSYTDKKVTSGKKYSYKVKQMCDGYISAAKKNGKSATAVAAVKGIKAVNSPNGIAVSWSKVKGAKGYSVWRKTGENGKWKKLGTVKKQSKALFTDKKPLYGKKSYYKVRAYRSSEVYGGFSAEGLVYAVNPDKPMIALTYDDGPYAPVTNRILDALEKHNARATFFIVGSRAPVYSDCIKRQAVLGCEVANHSYSHPILTGCEPEVIREEIGETDKLIEKYSSVSPKLVRAPGGAINDKVRENVKHPLINWSVDTLDWNHRTASKTVESVKRCAFDGAIVLMHDLYIPTAAASETIIPWLINEGYQLVTVSEMMDAKGITLQNGTLYTRA